MYQTSGMKSSDQHTLSLNKSAYFKSIGYEPEPIQWAVHNSKARFRVNIQGRRSGKSYSASREAELGILKADSSGWVVAPSYELAHKIGRQIFSNLILKYRLPTITKKIINGQLFYAKFLNNSEIWIKSADSPDTSLVGEGLDFLIIDECALLPKRIWEQYLRPTLSDRQGWSLFTSTPRGFNWIYDLYLRGQSEEFPDWDSWQHPSYSSKYFKDNIEDLKNELTKETYLQEYEAQFTSYAGKVYPFDRNKHVGKYPFIKEWDTFCSIDFGYRMPSAVWFQVGKVDNDVQVHIIDEIIHETNIKTEELVQKILQKGHPVLPTNYFCDPAGAGFQSISGSSETEIFKRYGIFPKFKTDKISRNISSGIDLVRSFIENAEKKARLFIDESCHGIIEDFENYRYPEKKDNQALKEEPLKDGRHDHGMDAVRYFFINKFPIKKREVLEVSRW